MRAGDDDEDVPLRRELLRLLGGDDEDEDDVVEVEYDPYAITASLTAAAARAARVPDEVESEYEEYDMIRWPGSVGHPR